jgi:hypothetical protein
VIWGLNGRDEQALDDLSRDRLRPELAHAAARGYRQLYGSRIVHHGAIDRSDGGRQVEAFLETCTHLKPVHFAEPA